MHELQLSNSSLSNPQGVASLLRSAVDRLAAPLEFPSDDDAAFIARFAGGTAIPDLLDRAADKLLSSEGEAGAVADGA